MIFVIPGKGFEFKWSGQAIFYYFLKFPRWYEYTARFKTSKIIWILSFKDYLDIQWDFNPFERFQFLGRWHTWFFSLGIWLPSLSLHLLFSCLSPISNMPGVKKLGIQKWLEHDCCLYEMPVQWSHFMPTTTYLYA